MVLNPVRAGMVRLAQGWPWSSYAAMTGQMDPPRWLATDALLSAFGVRGSAFGASRAEAMRDDASFVAEGVKAAPLWDGLQGQVYWGDAGFARMLSKAGQLPALEVPRAQRRAPPAPLAEIAARHASRDAAIAAARASGHYSHTEIASHFGLQFTTVGRVVREAKRGRMLGSWT